VVRATEDEPGVTTELFVGLASFEQLTTTSEAATQTALATQ
jgi:hypothetical protein